MQVLHADINGLFAEKMTLIAPDTRASLTVIRRRSQKMTDTLKAQRDQIDAIDRKIVELLDNRADIASKIAGIRLEKPESHNYDLQRESEVLQRIASASSGAFPKRALQNVFCEIISECRNIITKDKIYILGEKYGLVHDAATCRFAHASETGVVETGEELLEAIKDGRAHIGVFQMRADNSDLFVLLEAILSGIVSIGTSFDYRPRFALVSPRRFEVPELTDIYVTRDILSTLRAWFAGLAYPIRINLCRSNEEVIENLADGRGVGGVVPERLARNFENLKIVKPGIEASTAGPVRCMAVTALPGNRIQPGTTVSILCAPGESRSLCETMLPIAAQNVKLCDLETFRFHNKPWQELYFIRIQLPTEEKASMALLESMKANTSKMVVSASREPGNS